MSREMDLLHRLISLHDKQLTGLKAWDAYYEGEQPLSYMHPELLARLEGQVRQVVINWPQMLTDAITERRRLDWFRCPSDAPKGTDELLWQMWQARGGTGVLQRATVEEVGLGRGYISVGTPASPDDAPVVTDESPLDVIAVADPQTRETSAALRRWSEDDENTTASTADRATLYLPEATIGYAKDDSGEWKETSRDKHELGVVPVVPLVNRERRKRWLGVSELKLVTPISDAACKIATDMMVGANFAAIPRYYATGVRESDFTDENSNPISVWETVTGHIWSTEDPEAKLGAFPAADLGNFVKVITVLEQVVCSLCGLPPYYLGFATDNPASAEGIKASESRLVKRVEMKNETDAVRLRQVARLMHRIETGRWEKTLRALSSDFRSPATPTEAQLADATQKLYAAGIIPLRYARQRMGYTPGDIEQMEQLDAEAASTEDARVNRAIGEKSPIVPPQFDQQPMPAA